MTFSVPEKFRIRSGRVGSDASFGNNGAFEVRLRHSQTVYVIASDGAGWEHVSACRRDRCPTWDEMCLIKDIFWDEEECVVQFHPPRSQYVDTHPYCLHLWKKIGETYETPPKEFV